MSALVFAFTVPGPPVPCARARVVKGHAFTPARTEAYERTVALVASAAARIARWSPPDGSAFELEIDVYRAAKRGDWDNYAKGIADGLTRARIWPDDRFVELATVRMYVDRKNPRANIVVRAIASAA